MCSALGPATLLKKKLAQVISCEFCGIFKSNSGGCFWIKLRVVANYMYAVSNLNLQHHYKGATT